MCPQRGPASRTRPWPMPAAAAATAVGLVVALVGPPALAMGSRLMERPRPTLMGDIVAQLGLCAMAVIIVGIVARWERLPMASLGLRRPDAWTAVVALRVGAVGYYVLPLATAPLTRILGSGRLDEGLAAIARQPVWWRVCVAVTSGPVEELLYLGYAVERLNTLTSRLWLGSALAAVAFGLAHVPLWGLGPALALDLPFGALMVVAYLWRRDVVATAIAHTGLLLVVGLFGV
jgi:membrane protease YdiL (CAAX protease family)